MKQQLPSSNCNFLCKDCEMFTDERIDGSCVECYNKRSVNKIVRPSEPIGMQDPGLTISPELTPQDKGEPSPVPYTLMLSYPSPDIDPTGKRRITLSMAAEHPSEFDDVLRTFIGEDYYTFYLANAIVDALTEKQIYRIEMIYGAWSIKVYKHPNNP